MESEVILADHLTRDIEVFLVVFQCLFVLSLFHEHVCHVTVRRGHVQHARGVWFNTRTDTGAHKMRRQRTLVACRTRARGVMEGESKGLYTACRGEVARGEAASKLPAPPS